VPQPEETQKPPAKPPKIAVAIICGLGIALTLGSILWAGRAQVSRGADDFLPLYAGARLIGSAGIYDPAAIARQEIRAAGVTAPSLLYTRLPCFALLLWPLGQLPYELAHAVWYVLRIIAVIAFVLLWPGHERNFSVMVCCWSLPLAIGLANGQDGPFLLLWLALAERLQSSDRPFSAGLILSLCLAKFHLFLLLPFLFVIHRRWGAIWGFASGGCLLAISCWLAAGWDWPVRYLHILSLSQINPGRWVMPNIHGLLPSGPVEWWATSAVALGTVLLMSRIGYHMGLAAALTGSLLISYHAYPQDAVILIPPILIVFRHESKRALRLAALVLASPLPWILLLARQG
jgi:hypothetical protein